jgi:hypothetical protein
MMKKHLDRYARWAKGSQQLVGRYFDENAGRTGNPIPTIIVGDHVVRAAMPRRSTTTRCSAPSRTPRCRRVPVSKICVNYLGHQGTNEWAGVPTDQDARPADSVADAWEASSAVVWRQAAIDLGSAGVFNHDHRPAVFGWSHAAIGGGQVAGPTHAHHVFTRVRQGHR